MINTGIKQKLQVGDILAAKSTYSWEFLHYTFYKVLKVTESMVTLAKIETETIYDDGKTGGHYYDDPYCVTPKMIDGHYVLDNETIRRKVSYTKEGLPRVKMDFDKISRGVWEGKPLRAYNYH